MIYLSYNSKGKYWTLRRIVRNKKCAMCGDTRAHGGTFQYGRLYDNRTHVMWQLLSYCGIAHMREHAKWLEVLRVKKTSTSVP